MSISREDYCRSHAPQIAGHVAAVLVLLEGPDLDTAVSTALAICGAIYDRTTPPQAAPAGGSTTHVTLDGQIGHEDDAPPPVSVHPISGGRVRTAVPPQVADQNAWLRAERARLRSEGLLSLEEIREAAALNLVDLFRAERDAAIEQVRQLRQEVAAVDHDLRAQQDYSREVEAERDQARADRPRGRGA